MPATKFALDLDLPITLDRAASTSIYRQLCEQLRRAILDGRISGGTRLPSTRALALVLGVSRTVTSSAYDELFAEGYLEGRHGSGTYVRTDLPLLPRLSLPVPHTLPRWLEKAPSQLYEAPIPPQAIAFRLGIPSLSSLPPRIWREAWKTVTSHLPPDNHGSTGGNPARRAELAVYLGRSHGLACTPENILITESFPVPPLYIGMELVFSEKGVPRGRGKVERFFRSVDQLFLQDVPGYAPKGLPGRESISLAVEGSQNRSFSAASRFI